MLLKKFKLTQYRKKMFIKQTKMIKGAIEAPLIVDPVGFNN
jgi:hypothetical protein